MGIVRKIEYRCDCCGESVWDASQGITVTIKFTNPRFGFRDYKELFFCKRCKQRLWDALGAISKITEREADDEPHVEGQAV